jgi:hypothetical protein
LTATGTKPEKISSCKYFGAMEEFVDVSATIATRTMRAIAPFPAPTPKYLQDEKYFRWGINIFLFGDTKHVKVGLSQIWPVMS